MKRRHLWILAGACCLGPALLAQVNVEVQRIVEFVGDRLKVKQAEVSESLVAADVTADKLQVNQGVAAASVTASGPVQAQSLQSASGVSCQSLTAWSVGAPGAPVGSITAGAITAQQITAQTLAVDKITLTSGGRVVGEWTPSGLVLTGSAATVAVQIEGNPQLTMKSADGKTTISAVLNGDQPSVTLVSEAGETTWKVNQGQTPTLALGPAIFPPPVEQTIVGVDGADDPENQVRYWVSGRVAVKAINYWRLEWTAQVQCIREFFRPRKVSLTIRFYDADGIQLGEQHAYDIALAKDVPVSVSGTVDVQPEIAEKVRKVDLAVSTRR